MKLESQVIFTSLGQTPTESGHLSVFCVACLLYGCFSMVNMNKPEVLFLIYTRTSLFLARAWMNSALSITSPSR